MNKKILLIILPIFAFILVACFGNDVEDEVSDIWDGARDTMDEVTEPTTESYSIHNPQAPFEVEMRDKLDVPLQTHVGYDRVVARERDDLDDSLGLWSWGYEISRPMTQDDYIALDDVFADAGLSIMIDGATDNFQEFFETWPDWEMETILGEIEVEGEMRLWTVEFDENEQILWFGSLMGTY